MLILQLIAIQYTPISSARDYLITTDSKTTLEAETSDFGVIQPDSAAVSTTLTISYEYERFARPEGFPFQIEGLLQLSQLKL